MSIMNTQNNKQPKTSTSSERLATCSLIAGITGIICSFLYLPVSLSSGSNYPTGLICGVIGFVLAIMSKNADIRPNKTFHGQAVAGMILSSIAIGLTMFFFYSLISFYDALGDPIVGPQLNEIINRMQQQINQQLQQAAPAGTSFLFPFL